jgi:hypothetical protein
MKPYGSQGSQEVSIHLSCIAIDPAVRLQMSLLVAEDVPIGWFIETIHDP